MSDETLISRDIKASTFKHKNLESAFSNGRWSKNCKTVGEVIDELSRLPRGLPVCSLHQNSVDLVIFNRGTRNQCLEFQDGHEWDNGGKLP